jgi:hypothetical protein
MCTNRRFSKAITVPVSAERRAVRHPKCKIEAAVTNKKTPGSRNNAAVALPGTKSKPYHRK